MVVNVLLLLVRLVQLLGQRLELVVVEVVVQRSGALEAAATTTATGRCWALVRARAGAAGGGAAGVVLRGALQVVVVVVVLSLLLFLLRRLLLVLVLVLGHLQRQPGQGQGRGRVLGIPHSGTRPRMTSLQIAPARQARQQRRRQP